MRTKKKTKTTQTPAQVNEAMAARILAQHRFALGDHQSLYVERDGQWHRTGRETICAAIIKRERGRVDWTRARRAAAIEKRIRHRVPPLPPDARLAEE